MFCSWFLLYYCFVDEEIPATPQLDIAGGLNHATFDVYLPRAIIKSPTYKKLKNALLFT